MPLHAARREPARGRLRLLLLAVAALALAQCGERATATGEVKLYTAPAASSASAGLIPRGAAVKLSNCSNGWCEVSWNGQRGYALAKAFRVEGRSARAVDAGGVDEEDTQEDRSDTDTRD